MNTMYLKSLAEKVVVAFVVAFVGVVATGWTGDLSVPTIKALVAAGLGAGAAAVLGVVSKPIGNANSANVINPTPAPTPPPA